MTLAEFCHHFSVPKKMTAAKLLDDQRTEFDFNRTIAGIALARGTSPENIYRELR